MKTKKWALVGVLLLSFGMVACGGGGGGSGGGSSTDPDGGGGGATGSATLTNVSADTPGSICVKDNKPVASPVYTTQGPCQAAGGTWTTSSVPTGDRCQIGSLVYARISGGGSASTADIESCEAFGIFTASMNENVSYCSGGTAPSCGDIGGSMINVSSVSGLIDQTTVALEAGNNILTGESGLFGLSCAIQDGSGNPNCDGASPTESPYMFVAITKIHLGVDRWQSMIIERTGVGFSGYTGSSSDTPSFSVVLPIKTNKKLVSGFEASLKVEGFSLLYQQ